MDFGWKRLNVADKGAAHINADEVDDGSHGGGGQAL
jgi:hypothetical protein